MSKISLITIGTELLKGRIVNTNASQIGAMLRPNGFNLARTVVIPDTADAIRETLTSERKSHQVVILSGGLGSTEDDITKRVLCEIMDTELVLHPPTLAYLQDRFAKRGRVFSKRNQQQALLPASCTVLPNPMGTAPGMLFHTENSVVISLPGVPFEMLYLMEHAVLPFLKENFDAGFFQQEILRLAQIPESEVADRILKISPTLPQEVDIAYLPRKDGIWLELFVGTENQSEQGELASKLTDAKERISELLKDKEYAQGDLPVSKLLMDLCLSKKLSVSVAESITGGGISAELVSHSGASAYFKGGICAYDTSIKTQVLGVQEKTIQQKGVVSMEVALEMAVRVREIFNSDIGLATTGYAEKNEHADAQVWIAYADQRNRYALRTTLYGDRGFSISRAIQSSLIFCLDQVQGGH